MGAAHARRFFDFLVAEAVLVFHQDGVALAFGQLFDEFSGQSVAFLVVVLRWLGKHQAFRIDRHGGALFPKQVDAAPFHDGQAELFHVLTFYRRALFPKCDDGFLNGIRCAVGVADDTLGGPLQSGLQSQDISFELFGRHSIWSFAIISWKRLKSYIFWKKHSKLRKSVYFDLCFFQKSVFFLLPFFQKSVFLQMKNYRKSVC